MYDLDIKPSADRIFKKMMKKEKHQLMIIHKKILEIRQNPDHDYKHLRKPLQDFYRVHIDSNFVLIFDIVHEKKVIEVYYYDHHDNVYKWRPKPEDG